MKTVIKAEKLSKKFQLGLLLSDGESLRDLVGNIIKNPFRDKSESDNKSTLWALKDVSFEVKEGDTFGIIGRNGAGKSTLLKVLSRIIRPTSGRAILAGRVGSLLEIGTGFHQDLTGRENIYLNGSVLGMRRHEVEEKFDEIVAFSGLEKFLETSVKYYSSGMYARLAFAVAAHLEPDILIIDEVLAVGDAVFQAKCLGKMGEVAKSGRTVLFVSHDVSAVRKLCKKGLYLEKGQVKDCGNIEEIMQRYKNDYQTDIATHKVSRMSEDIAENTVRFIEWQVLDSISRGQNSIFSGENVTFDFILISKRPTEKYQFKFLFQDDLGRPLFVAENELQLKSGKHHIQFSCALPLNPDSYQIIAECKSAKSGEIIDIWTCEPNLTVFSENLAIPSNLGQGILNIPVNFTAS